MSEAPPPIGVALVMSAARELAAAEVELRAVLVELGDAQRNPANAHVLLAYARRLCSDIERTIGRLGDYLPRDVVSRVQRLCEEVGALPAGSDAAPAVRASPHPHT